MNEVQIHLLLNHLPSVGQVAGFGAFLIGWLLKKNVVKNTGVWIIFIASLFVMPVNWSGEGAEEIAENLPGVSESVMHDHEEAAETAMIFTIISGIAALALIAVNRWKQSLNSVFSVILLVACLSSLFFLIDASHKGGLIRHPELSNTAAFNMNPSTGSGSSVDQNEEEDDD